MQADIEDGQQAKGASLAGSVTAVLQGSAHPGALALHVGLRVCTLVLYIVAPLFVSFSFAGLALPVLLLQLADFWAVKNVTGRLLIGRRWWTSATAPSGWAFEARAAPYAPRPADAQLFWAALYAYPAAWVLLALASLFRMSPSWLAVDVCGASLAATNVLGYRRCDAHASVQQRFSPNAGSIAGRILGASVFGL